MFQIRGRPTQKKSTLLDHPYCVVDVYAGDAECHGTEDGMIAALGNMQHNTKAAVLY